MSHSSKLPSLRRESREPPIYIQSEVQATIGIHGGGPKWGQSYGTQPLTCEVCTSSGQVVSEVNCRIPTGVCTVGELVGLGEILALDFFGVRGAVSRGLGGSPLTSLSRCDYHL